MAGEVSDPLTARLSRCDKSAQYAVRSSSPVRLFGRSIDPIPRSMSVYSLAIQFYGTRRSAMFGALGLLE
jgi:hypothetical protein